MPRPSLLRRRRRRPRLARHDEASLIEHLEELRARMFVALGAFAVAFAAAYALHARIVHALESLLPGGAPPLATFGVAEPLMLSLRVSMWTALIVTAPIAVWQVWCYVAPALDVTSRRAVVATSLAGTALFALGIAFGWLLAIPQALSFLTRFDRGLYHTQLRAHDLLSFELTALLAMGIVFELPIALLALVRCRVLSASTLRRRRREGWAVTFAIAVALPGVDPVLTGLEALPLLVLYEGTVLVAGLLERRWARDRAESVDEDRMVPAA